jgi:hypothetical protein
VPNTTLLVFIPTMGGDDQVRCVLHKKNSSGRLNKNITRLLQQQRSEYETVIKCVPRVRQKLDKIHASLIQPIITR